MRLQNVIRTQDTGDHEEKSLRDVPLEKLWGGDFWAAGIFFRYQIPCTNFLGRSMNILGLIGVHELFYLIFPCDNIFLVLPPIRFLMVRPLCHWDKLDFEILQNWLSGLTRQRLKIARHHWVLHGRGSVVSAVSSRRMHFFVCFGNCLISSVLTKKT